MSISVLPRYTSLLTAVLDDDDPDIFLSFIQSVKVEADFACNSVLTSSHAWAVLNLLLGASFSIL